MTKPNSTVRLTSLRVERGWSQEDLAQASGVSARTIQRLESGAAASHETTRAIAAAFDLDPRDLREEPIPTGKSATNHGMKWGIAGTLIGFASAFVSVSHAFFVGQTTGVGSGHDSRSPGCRDRPDLCSDRLDVESNHSRRVTVPQNGNCVTNRDI